MIEYEICYLVGESKESDLSSIKESVEKIITNEGGVFLAPMTEEKRKMAYEIKKETRGIYIARRFTLPDKDERDEKEEEKTVHPLTTINRALQLSKDVLRFIILRAEELPELKAIPRVEKPKTEAHTGHYEKRGAMRPMPQSPIAPKEETKKVSNEEIDDQLKAQLDI